MMITLRTAENGSSPRLESNATHNLIMLVTIITMLLLLQQQPTTTTTMMMMMVVMMKMAAAATTTTMMTKLMMMTMLMLPMMVMMMVGSLWSAFRDTGRFAALLKKNLQRTDTHRNQWHKNTLRSIFIPIEVSDSTHILTSGIRSMKLALSLPAPHDTTRHDTTRHKQDATQR